MQRLEDFNLHVDDDMPWDFDELFPDGGSPTGELDFDFLLEGGDDTSVGYVDLLGTTQEAVEPKKIVDDEYGIIDTDYPTPGMDYTELDSMLNSIFMLDNMMESDKRKEPVKFDETFEKVQGSGRIGRIHKSEKRSPQGKKKMVKGSTRVVTYPRSLNWIMTNKETEEWPNYKQRNESVFGMYSVEGRINKEFTGNLLTGLGNFVDLSTLQNIPNACDESKVTVRIFSNYCRDGVTCGAYNNPEHGPLFADSMQKYIVVDLVANDTHNEKIEDCCIAIDDEKLVRVIAVKKNENMYTFISAPVKATNSNKKEKVTLFGMGRGSTRPMLREYKIVLFNSQWKVEKKVKAVIMNAKAVKDFFSGNRTRNFEKAEEFVPMCIDDLV